MKEQLRAWQLHWHDLFDEDATLKGREEFARPSPVPDDMGSDFRLIFGLAHATLETRARCFALFPEGARMARRLGAYLSRGPARISEARARAALPALFDLIETLGATRAFKRDTVFVVDRETEEGLASLMASESIGDLVDHPRYGEQTAASSPAIAADLFLTEPLYATGGNFYHLHDWITGAMFGGQVDALQTALYRLWEGGWQVHSAEHGIVLAGRGV